MESVSIGVPRSHWKELLDKTNCPSPRSGHSAVIYSSSMYIFAGHNGTNVVNDHFRLNLLTCKWEKLSENSDLPSIPSARTSHSAAVDDLAGLIYVFGGSGKDFGSSNKSDLFVYVIRDNAWEGLSPQGSGPGARYGHSMTLFNSALYVFGGTSGTVFFNDLYLFELDKHCWIQLTIKQNPPPIRYKHTARVLNNKLLIIGGAEYKTILKDIWEIDLETLSSSKLEIQNTSLLANTAQAAEVYKTSIYLLGQYSQQQAVSSLWKMNLKKKNWVEEIQLGSRPPAMTFFTMVLCEGYLVIFGGNINEARTNKTFIFRLSMYIPEQKSPIGRLYNLMISEGPHADTMVQSLEAGFFSQQVILKIRCPLLCQESIDSGNYMIINLPYSAETVRALLLYVYQDTVDPLMSVQATLALFSIAAIYGIPPLLNKLCLILCRSLLSGTAKTIANYISRNSVEKLFHRNEFRDNINKFPKNSTLDEILIKHMTENLELSSGEQVYWEAIEKLKRVKSLSELSDTVKADIMRLKAKDAGKSLSPKTAQSHDLTDLQWSLTLLYQTPKDMQIIASGTKLSAHKSVLISNSQYFEAYFLSNKTQEPCSLDIPSDIAQHLILYMYFGPKGIQELDAEVQSSLMPYADYLMITNKQLHDYIGNMITDIIDKDNVFEYLLSAHRMNATIMKHMILEYFVENYKELVEKEEMFGLPVEILVEIHRWNASKFP